MTTYRFNASATDVARERAGFITFWLWLGIIANVISLPFTIMYINGMSNLGQWGMELILYGVDLSPFTSSINPPKYMLMGAAILSAISCFWGYALLLKWKKSGFTVISIFAIINVIMQFICYPMIEEAYASIGLVVDYSAVITLISAAVSIVVLWAVLQIRKNGVSCWSQLK